MFGKSGKTAFSTYVSLLLGGGVLLVALILPVQSATVHMLGAP